MKRLFFIISLLCGPYLFAQMPVKFELGVRGGFTWTDLDMEPFRAETPMGATDFRSGAWNAGGQIVAHARLQVLSFFVQPEWTLTRNEGSIWAYPETGYAYPVHDYTFTKMDGHLSFGIKLFSLIRVQGGPSMSYILKVRDGNTNATDQFAATTFGWHAGVGVDISKLRLDFRYEPGLNHRSGALFGQEYAHSVRQWVLGVGLRF